MSESIPGIGAIGVVPFVGVLRPQDYLPEFYQASWKGIPFHVEKADDTYGRRGDIYEYPLGEDVAYKDLGRKARKFKIDGYVIGGNQVELTTEMIQAAESPEPGELVHPILGTIIVACIKLSVKVDLRKEIRASKLSFEFVEAAPSMAPYTIGPSIGTLFDIHWNVIYAIVRWATWGDRNTPATASDQQAASRISRSLAQLVAPAVDEESYDTIDRLTRDWTTYQSFERVAVPLIDGTATIRRIHEDAASRLARWNAVLTAESGTWTPTQATIGGGGLPPGTPGTGSTDIKMHISPAVESLVLIARATLARDLSLTIAQTTYRTIHEALEALDFLIRMYDEEEAIAVHRCADELTLAIRAARATAIQSILNANIRLPGIIETDINGVWPSLLAAHKVFGDSRRYADIEAYNTGMNPMFIGSRIISPAV